MWMARVCCISELWIGKDLQVRDQGLIYTGIHLNEASALETHFLQHQNKQYNIKCPYTNIQPWKGKCIPEKMHMTGISKGYSATTKMRNTRKHSLHCTA